MTHSGRFSPEHPEQRVTLSLQSPLIGCTPKNPTERSSLELCRVYLLVTTDRLIAEVNDTMTK